MNKNSEGFVKPSAESSDADGQDDASKRSLKWFMDWFEEKYGKDKAQRLWKRMGTVTIRTILSILPILSREYDQQTYEARMRVIMFLQMDWVRKTTLSLHVVS